MRPIRLLLKEARKKQHLSMNALSKASDVPQSSISEIEAGKRQPSFESVVKLIEALGISCAEFLDEKPRKISPLNDRLSKCVEKIDDHSLEKLILFLESLDSCEQPTRSYKVAEAREDYTNTGKNES